MAFLKYIWKQLQNKPLKANFCNAYGCGRLADIIACIQRKEGASCLKKKDFIQKVLENIFLNKPAWALYDKRQFIWKSAEVYKTSEHFIVILMWWDLMQKRQKVFKPSPSIKLKKADVVKLFFNRLGYVAPQKTHRVIQQNRIRIERVLS